jgi:hypothetical protein
VQDAEDHCPQPYPLACAPDMSTLRTFLSEFWPIFTVTAVFFPLLWLGRAKSLDAAPSLVSPRHFSMLAPLPEDERKRVLQNAYCKAFSAWRLGITALLYAALLSVSLAAGRTLAKAGIIPDSFWTSTAATLLLLAPGWWGLRRLEVRRVRRFLVAQVERAPGDTGQTDQGTKGKKSSK